METKIRALVKFGKHEHMKSLQEGYLYFSPLGTFQRLEKTTNKKGRGDYADGRMIQKVYNAKFVPKGSNGEYDMSKAVFAGTINIDALIDGQDLLPVFCLMWLDDSDFYEGTNQIRDEILLRMKSEFEDIDSALLILRPDDFFENLRSNIGVNSFGHHVFYMDNETIEFMVFCEEGNIKLKDQFDNSISYSVTDLNKHKLAFKKGVYFSYQKEYRIVLPNERINCGRLYPIHPIQNSILIQF